MLLQADVAPYNPVRMPYSAPYGLSLALSRLVHGGRHRVSPEYEAKTDRPIMARFAPYGLRRFSLGINNQSTFYRDLAQVAHLTAFAFCYIYSPYFFHL